MCSVSPILSTVHVGPLKKRKKKKTRKNLDRKYALLVEVLSINGTPTLENCLIFLNICVLYNLRVVIEWNAKYLFKESGIAKYLSKEIKTYVLKTIYCIHEMEYYSVIKRTNCCYLMNLKNTLNGKKTLIESRI